MHAVRQQAGGSKSAPVQFELEDDYGEKHSYFLVKHGARQGWPLGLKLLRILGPALGVVVEKVDFSNVGDVLQQVVTAVKDGDLETEVTGAGLGTAVGSIASTAGELAGHLLADPTLVNELFEHTVRDNMKVVECFDEAFMGNYGELLGALWRVISENFGPLFRRRLGLLSAGRQATAVQAASVKATL